MKKQFTILLIFSLFATVTFAQNSAVSKAAAAEKKGELAKAKEYIDAAIVHEKTSEKGKTWYTKGLIYEAIAFSDNEAYKALVADPVEQAVAAYAKAKGLEKDGSTYHLFSNQKINGIWEKYINDGADAYGKKNYKAAILAFDKTILVKPSDTTGYLYAAIAAQIEKQYDKTETYYNKLKTLNYSSPDMYKSLIYIQRAHHKDNDKALAVIKEAREKYPNDADLMKEEINVLIIAEKTDEAKEKLEAAIKTEPENSNLQYNLAFLNDQIGDRDKAIEHYKRAIEIKPDYFDALYNVGVMNFNEGAKVLNIANKMDLKEYQKSGQKYIDEANVLFKEATPYFEKALEIKPGEMALLQNLETIYRTLKQFDKVEAIQAKIAAIQGN